MTTLKSALAAMSMLAALLAGPAFPAAAWAGDKSEVIHTWSLYLTGAKCPHPWPVFYVSIEEGGTFRNRCDDESFTLKLIGDHPAHERGTYSVWGDSLALHILESDVPGRVGTTVTVAFSVHGLLATFTNARQLTFGYVEEDEATFVLMGMCCSPYSLWWELYDPERLPEPVAQFGMHFEVCGSFYSFGCSGEEWGSYVVSGDSITITIAESDLPDRVGTVFTTVVIPPFESPEPYPPWVLTECITFMTFTNASMLTARCLDQDLITLCLGVTGGGGNPAQESSWGRVKSSYR